MTMKKDGRCAQKKDNGAHMSTPSSCSPLSLLLVQVTTAIATLDILARDTPLIGREALGEIKQCRICIKL